MTFSSLPSVLLLISAVGGAHVLHAQSIIIDSFTDIAEHAVSAVTPYSSLMEESLPGVLGGSRTSALLYTTIALPPNRKARLDIGYGFFNHSNDVGVTSITRLEYGSTTPLDADLSSLSSFLLSSWTLDQGTVEVTLSLTSGTMSESATLSLAATEVGTDHLFDFALFPTIDFSDVDRITLEFIANRAGQDASFGPGGFSVIPEPSLYGLVFGGSIVGLSSLRRIAKRRRLSDAR